jgi:hypothetical protein
MSLLLKISYISKENNPEIFKKSPEALLDIRLLN